MQEILLVKNGEIVLKGLNRPTFEGILVKNIKHRLSKCGRFTVTKAQSAMYITPEDDDFDMDEAVKRLRQVFGIASFSRAFTAEKSFDSICKTAEACLADVLSSASTFKVEAKRSDKRFPLTSPEICAQLGEYLLEKFGNLSVDVHNPDVTVFAEVRDFAAYVHAGFIKGAGGMPVGSNGRAALLISGGIDSPVAGYMLAKRGVSLCAVHFASPPYTSERAKLKVLDLLKAVSCYSGRISCYVVPFTRIQEEIRRNCPEDLFTLIMRRNMMKCANLVAKKEGCSALITGESLGQVASQTIEAITCTDDAAEKPVLRPLIGMDKEEIITVARAIGTFDISIQPYEDCCTIFTPKHPRTRPKLGQLLEAEAAFDFGPLIEQAVSSAEQITI